MDDEKTNSILNTIKEMLDIESEDSTFDTEIIININSVLFFLNQLGIGDEAGFYITGTQEEWEDFIGTSSDLEAIKTYIYLQVRLLFDPPSTSYLISAMERQVSELEWRLNIQAEGGDVV